MRNQTDATTVETLTAEFWSGFAAHSDNQTNVSNDTSFEFFAEIPCNSSEGNISTAGDLTCEGSGNTGGGPPSMPFLPWNNPYNVISFETYLTVEKTPVHVKQTAWRKRASKINSLECRELLWAMLTAWPTGARGSQGFRHPRQPATIQFVFSPKLVCYVSIALMIFGVPINVVNCVAFFRQGLRDRMNLSLFSLALLDMFNILSWNLLTSSCFLGKLMPQIQDWWKWTAHKYVRGLHGGFMFSSGCLTMIVAVERCVCVYVPMKAANLLRTRTMAVIIVFAVALIHLICAVNIFNYDVVTVVNPITGRPMVRLAPSAAYKQHTALIDFVENILLIVVIPTTFLTVVSISTLITVIKLRQSIAWRLQSICDTPNNSASVSSNIRSQITLVKMLVIVSCIYIVTSLPNIAIGITRSVVHDYRPDGRYRNIFVATHLLNFLLSLINSSVNFFVYYARSSRFRRELNKMFPCCNREK